MEINIALILLSLSTICLLVCYIDMVICYNKGQKVIGKVEQIAQDLILMTNEYADCYHKDECNICKKECQYRSVDNILQIIEGEEDEY